MIVKPVVTLISAGRNHKWNHPHKDISERFQKRKIKYFVTRKTGSMRITWKQKRKKISFHCQ